MIDSLRKSCRLKGTYANKAHLGEAGEILIMFSTFFLDFVLLNKGCNKRCNY